MYHQGFLKIALVTPSLEVGNPEYNVSEILKTIQTWMSGLRYVQNYRSQAMLVAIYSIKTPSS